MDTATAPSEDLAECSGHDLLVFARSLPLDSQRRAAALQMEHTLEMEALSAHWSELPARQQRILLGAEPEPETIGEA